MTAGQDDWVELINTKQEIKLWLAQNIREPQHPYTYEIGKGWYSHWSIIKHENFREIIAFGLGKRYIVNENEIDSLISLLLL